MNRQSILFAFVLFGSLVLLLIVTSPLLFGTVPLYGDLEAYHLPAKRFYYDCLTSGQAFDWMPHLLGGFYLSGEGEMGTYHPLHLIMYRWLSFETAFTLDFIAPFPLSFLGVFLFLRRIIDRSSALLGSALWTFSFFFMTNIGYPHLNIVMAHTPWILLAMDLMFVTTERVNELSLGDRSSPSSEPRFLKRVNVASSSGLWSWPVLCAAVGFLTGSQILFGHPHALWLSLIIEVGYLLSFIRREKAFLFASAFFLSGKILGFSLGAVQLIATYSAFRNSTRLDYTEADIYLFSLPPRAYLGAVAPYLFWNRVPGFGGIYFGTVPLLLSGWWISGFFLGIRRRYKKLVNREERTGNETLGLMALVLILISTWLATGLYGGLYDLHRLIPIVANLRAPARYLVLTQFGICLIAAIAFGDLVKKANKRRTSQWQEVLPWIITLLSILSAVFFANTASITPVSDKEAFFYPAPLFFFFAAIGLSLAIRGRKTGLFILVIIAFIDIGYYNFGLPVVRHTIFEARPYAQWKNKVEEPPYRGSGRVFYRDAMEDLLYLLDYSLINGYTGGMTPKKLLDYDDLDVLRIADVEWVFRGKSRPVGSRPGGRAHTDWIHVPNRLPKVRFATRTRVSHNPSRDIKKIDIKNTALVTRFTELKDGELGEAVVVGNKHGEIAIDAKTSSRQMLVLSESYHPEWQVFVDGKKDILYRVNGDFMGCILEKGKHKVNFIFIPYALTYGLPISIFGTSTTLLLCFIPFIARFISKRSNAQL